MIRAVTTAPNATRITGYAFLIESCQLLATTGSPTSSAKRLLVRANQPRTPGSAMNMGMRMEAKPRRTKASPTENIFPAMSSYTAKVTPGEIPEPMAAGNTRRSPTVCVDLGVQCSDNAHRDAGTQLDFRRGPSQCRNGHPGAPPDSGNRGHPPARPGRTPQGRLETALEAFFLCAARLPADPSSAAGCGFYLCLGTGNRHSPIHHR